MHGPYATTFKLACKVGYGRTPRLQAQRAAGGRHAHGNGGSAPGCVAGGPALAHRRTSDEGLRLNAAEAGSPARVQQVRS